MSQGEMSQGENVLGGNAWGKYPGKRPGGGKVLE